MCVLHVFMRVLNVFMRVLYVFMRVFMRVLHVFMRVLHVFRKESQTVEGKVILATIVRLFVASQTVSDKVRLG
jgi:CBS domain containing-hemolysin-like protein